MTPDENRNDQAVRRLVAQARERRLLAARTAREGSRRVELLDGRYVLKQFTYGPRERPRRRPWRHEHAALRQLSDPRLPSSIGYATEADPSGWTVSYVRSFVPGEPVTGFDAGSAAEAGGVLARLHARGVVTNDALTQNFLRGPDGHLFFLDFGKAQILPLRSPRLPARAALEHCRFLRASLAGDRRLWEAFRRAYFAAAGRGRRYETTVRGLSRVVLGLRRVQGRPD